MAHETLALLATCACVLALIRTTLQAGATKPVLTIPAGAAVVTVKETAAQKEELATGITCTDADAEDETRIYKMSVSPSTPCGKCFTIWPDATAATYSVWFNPGEGDKLSFSDAPSYSIVVLCTDDVNTVTAPVEVRLLGNSPPTFTTPGAQYVSELFRRAENQKAGATIYDTDAEDVDGDAIFYTMVTTPDEGLFEIGYTDGVIRAKKDLRFMCRETADFYVTADDVHNNPVPPRTIKMTFKDTNAKPEILNKQKLVEMEEDTTETSNRLVLTLNIPDTTVYSDLKWNMWAEPERGLDYYYLDEGGKPRIRTRKTLNYEYEPLRSVKLFLNVTDGFCKSDTYSVTVDVINVNEVPVLEPPQDLEIIAYEGLMEILPGWQAIDPDENEELTWLMTHNNFYIDSVSGIIYSVGEFDIDPNTERQIKTMDIEVEDKEGAKDVSRRLKLIVIDKNDNAPFFRQRLYNFGADECTPAGSGIGRLVAVDKDSKFQGNNILYYWGGGVNVTILNTGHVILTTPCKAGQTETFSVHVSDQGTYPGPLEGIPTTVRFKCSVCPPTVPPVTQDPNPCSGNNAGVGQCKIFSVGDLPDSAYPNTIDPLEDNVGWIAPACILTMILLALLAYMLWKYCLGKWLARRALLRKGPYPRKVMPHPKQTKKPPPPKKTAPKRRPTPPELPPERGAELYDFWKETYGDRDQRCMPARAVAPLSVAKDKVVEEKEKVEAEQEKAQWRQERQQEVDKYNQQMAQYHQQLHGLSNPPPPPPKKKRCTIL